MPDWKSRLKRPDIGEKAGALSESAREAVLAARRRIGSTYGVASSRAAALTGDGAELARTGIAASSRAATRGLAAIDKASFSARGLVAERPITAVVIGIGAGIVLGFLADRLARANAGAPQPVEDDEIYS